MSPSNRRGTIRWVICIVTLAVLVGVLLLRAYVADRATEPPSGPLPTTDSGLVPQEPRTVYPAAPRVVAIGDLHGDFTATRAALRLAGAIDESDRWVGGDLVVVQTGDQVDRGDGDREIIDLFSRLEIAAAESGGAFRPLIGNHEMMNAEGEFAYASARGLSSFDNLVEPLLRRPDLLAFSPVHRARAAAFLPGGPVAAILARRNVVAVIGDTAFVHAGVLPQHVAYGVERINKEVRAFLRGARKELPPIMAKPASPLWTRLYSLEAEPSAATCATLGEALAGLHVKRMVVGHTVQEGGITSGCDGRVYRIDTGMSAAYEGGPVSALEISGDRVTPLH